MKYKRTKPNHEFWRNRPPPPVKDEHPLDAAVKRIETALAPFAEWAKQNNLFDWDICATDGHNFTDRPYPGKIICSYCGQEKPAE